MAKKYNQTIYKIRKLPDDLPKLNNMMEKMGKFLDVSNLSGGYLISHEENVVVQLMNQYIGIGDTVPTEYGREGIWLGMDGSTPKCSFYKNATHYLKFDGSNLSISGTITALAGTIGGWDIQSTTLESANDKILLDSANERITINNSTFGQAGIQLDYNSGTPRAYIGNGSTKYFNWDGTNLSWAGANTSLTTGGTFTASDAVITGSITAATGAIGGWDISATTLESANDKIILDSSNEKITINNATFGQDGIQLDYNSGNPRAYIGDGSDAYLNFDGTKLTWKGAYTELDASGNLIATSVTLTGSITATTGAIGGWVVDATSIKDAAGVVGLSSEVTGGDDIRFWAGDATPASAEFKVTEAGALTASSATITGAITATSGTIGGFTVDATNGLYSGSGATRVQMKAGEGIWTGATASGSAPFFVDEAGALIASSATITGSITATTGAIGGFAIGANTLTGGTTNIILDSSNKAISINDATFGNAGIQLEYNAGTPRAYIGDGSTKYISWNGTFLAINDSIISAPATGTALGIMGWQYEGAFSVTDYNTVAWDGSGTLTFISGETYSIGDGDTGDMSAITYIYFDKGVSEVAFQTSTTASDAVGANKVLIAVAEDNADTGKDATLQVFGGIGGISTFITADNIAADTITANEILGNTITASQIAGATITATEMNVSQLSAIAADLGSITAGNITLNTSGYIKGGQTAYDTGTGFWLGYDSSAYKFSIGNAAADKLLWDGTNLFITGEISADSGDIGGWNIDATKIYKTNSYLSSDGYISFGDTPPTYFGNVAGAFMGYVANKPVVKYTITARTGAYATQQPMDWTLQGSNDDSNWDVLDTVTGETSWGSAEKRSFTFANTANYRYYKLDITANNGSSAVVSLSEIELIISDDVDEVADMTSATAPTPFVISHSSQYSATYAGWKAFDDNTATMWLTQNTVVTGWVKVDMGISAKLSLYKDSSNYLQWDGGLLTWKGANTELDASGNLTATGGNIGGWDIDVSKIYKDYTYLSSTGYISFGDTPPTEFGNNTGAYLGIDKKIIVKYTIMAGHTGLDVSPKDWTFQGSNNDSDWDILDTVTGETSWGAAEVRDFTFSNTTAYRYYKLDITANDGHASYVGFGEMELIVADDVDEVPTMTSNTAPAPMVISTSTALNASYYGWHVFDDGGSTTRWLTAGGQTTGWIKVAFGETMAKLSLYKDADNYFQWDGEKAIIASNNDDAVTINSGGSIKINDGGDILMRSDISNPAEIRFYTAAAPDEYISFHQESTGFPDNLVDIYSETNYNFNWVLGKESGTGAGGLAVGQSFTNTDEADITSCKFYLKKTGFPTGNAYAKLYAHSGVYGTSSVPTGAVLATSDAFDVSTLTSAHILTEFTFTGIEQYTMAAATEYVIVIDYGDGSYSPLKYVGVGGDSTSQTHGGNSCLYNSSSWAASAYDTIFYVYNDVVDAQTTGILFDHSDDAIDPFLKIDSDIEVQYGTTKPFAAWIPYTTAWTLTGAASQDGTITGGYCQIGKTVHYWSKFLVTAGSNFTGLTSITVPLPVTETGNPVDMVIGSLNCVNFETASYPGIVSLASTTTANIYIGLAGGTHVQNIYVAVGAPFAWGENDYMIISGTYEAA